MPPLQTHAFRFPIASRATQTHFPARPHKNVWHTDHKRHFAPRSCFPYCIYTGATALRSCFPYYIWGHTSRKPLPALHSQYRATSSAPRSCCLQCMCTKSSHFDDSCTLWQPPPSLSTTVIHTLTLATPTLVFDSSTVATSAFVFHGHCATDLAMWFSKTTKFDTLAIRHAWSPQRVSMITTQIRTSPHAWALDTHDLHRGCPKHNTICVSPHACALDTHELRKGFTTIKQILCFTSRLHTWPTRFKL